MLISSRVSAASSFESFILVATTMMEISPDYIFGLSRLTRRHCKGDEIKW